MIEDIAPRITTQACGCKAHTQHRVFQFIWNHPGAKQKQIAEALHTTPNNVKVAIHELRKRGNLARICPECFSASLSDDVCRACGFEPTAPDIPAALRFDEQSPVNHLHAGNQLGSVVDYNELKIKGIYGNDGLLLKQRMDRALEDPLTRDVKARVMQDLKAYYPTEAITDYSGRLCLKEVAEWRARYPLLATSKNVRKQLAMNVMRRLQFLYPALSPARALEVRQLA